MACDCVDMSQKHLVSWGFVTYALDAIVKRFKFGTMLCTKLILSSHITYLR